MWLLSDTDCLHRRDIYHCLMELEHWAKRKANWNWKKFSFSCVIEIKWILCITTKCCESWVVINWNKTNKLKRKMPDTEIELIDKNSLISELRSCSPTKKEVIILDCRSANDYATSHIKQSANISIPTIMLRRLKEGKIDLFSTIKCKDLKSRILAMDIQTLFVLYHNNSPTQSSPDIIQVLSRKLMAEFNDKKIRVVCLAGEWNSSAALPISIFLYIIHVSFSFIKKFARSESFLISIANLCSITSASRREKYSTLYWMMGIETKGMKYLTNWKTWNFFFWTFFSICVSVCVESGFMKKLMTVCVGVSFIFLRIRIGSGLKAIFLIAGRRMKTVFNDLDRSFLLGSAMMMMMMIKPQPCIPHIAFERVAPSRLHLNFLCKGLLVFQFQQVFSFLHFSRLFRSPMLTIVPFLLFAFFLFLNWHS